MKYFYNKCIKIFSPKEKPKSYALLQKKNYINKNNPTYNNFENSNININKNYLIPYNKNNRRSKYHPQKLKYINNEGKEIFLNEVDYINDKSNNNQTSKNKNNNLDEFTKLVQENKEIIKINDINKKKNIYKYNKIKPNKNSLEYKIKNINKAFKSLKK